MRPPIHKLDRIVTTINNKKVRVSDTLALGALWVQISASGQMATVIVRLSS